MIEWLFDDPGISCFLIYQYPYVIIKGINFNIILCRTCYINRLETGGGGNKLYIRRLLS